MRQRLRFVLLVLLVSVLGRPATAAEARKVAVIVGANQAPEGRVPLRYAHDDATQVSQALLAVGGFSARDIHLLFDPTPAQLLAALDEELALAARHPEETLLFFYYSGHADEQSIFPGGQALPFSELKARLEDPRAKLRVGLLDSCRGGSWTGSKGLKKVDPFQIDGAPQLAEEGSILIASSSGQESAHETEALEGSFFTHYWNAGLRGAADRGGDGVVTLNEAFEYARALTIRDTALIGQEPQHPSFQMKLSGRRDIPLSIILLQRTTLLYDQVTGPTEVVRLSDGLVVVEMPPGTRRVRLGLPAGSYLLRRRALNHVFARIVTLSAGSTKSVAESELERSNLAGRSKGLVDLRFEGISWKDQRAFVSLAVGVRHAPVIDPGLRWGAGSGNGVLLGRASLRLTRHLWWSAPVALVFDAERPSSFNWFAWAGVPVLSGAAREPEGLTLDGFLGTGLDARYRIDGRHTLNASLSGLSPFEIAHQAPAALATQLTLGLSETIPDTVTFNLGGGFSADVLGNSRPASAPSDSSGHNVALAFGSLQRIGLRPLPLIHIPIGEGWAIDAHAAFAYLPAPKAWMETYLVGVSYVN